MPPTDSASGIPAPGRSREITAIEDYVRSRMIGADAETPDYDPLTCTQCALHLKARYGGRIMGYFAEDNPEAEVGSVEGGHDFLVIDGRYVVDPWPVDVWGEQYTAQVVYDMHDPAGLAEVRRLYGDPARWVDVDLAITSSPVPELKTSVFGADGVEICRTLIREGYDAVIVGGPVRDALRGEIPNDIDIATSAHPNQVRALFPNTYVQGSGEKHGTIGVVTENGETFEVTTYRADIYLAEGESDGRYPDHVRFTDTIEEDLLRRDFTINAIAFRPGEGDAGDLIDPYGGVSDLATGVIRAVGSAEARFREDYLRILRAYRFAARFGFHMAPETRDEIRKAMGGLSHISAERIREELLKTGAQASDPVALRQALDAMHEDGAFGIILPELERCTGVTQNEHHAFDVLDHSLEVASLTAGSGQPALFMAALLHDIGKPATRTVGEDGRVHFYNHESAGARIADEILGRLKFPNRERDWIREAVQHHMRLMSAESTVLQGGKGARTAIARIARDLRWVTVEDLLELRTLDKAGSGLAEKSLSPVFIAAVKDILRQLQEDNHAFRITDLDISGNDLIETFSMRPGKQIGRILQALLDDVTEGAVENRRQPLLARARVIRHLHTLEDPVDQSPPGKSRTI